MNLIAKTWWFIKKSWQGTLCLRRELCSSLANVRSFCKLANWGQTGFDKQKLIGMQTVEQRCFY